MNYRICVNFEEILSQILTSDTPFDTPQCFYTKAFREVADTLSDTLAHTYKDVRAHVKDNII